MKTKSNMTVNKPKELDWEKVAFLFHNTYEGLAPKFGYETRKDTKEFDPESNNGKLMIATCKAVISKTLQQQKEDLIKEIEGIVGEDEDFEIEAPYMQHIKDSGTDCCFCSLCCGSEMDIQDTEKNGEYFCKCSVWDSSYEGNWIRWNIPETEVKKIILRHFPIPEDFRNQLRKEIRERLKQL